jgi:hypothetical protein
LLSFFFTPGFSGGIVLADDRDTTARRLHIYIIDYRQVSRITVALITLVWNGAYWSDTCV